jgi:hypothetical protein
LWSTLTSIIFFDVRDISFTLIDAVLASKVIDLRDRADLIDRRTFRLSFVPLRSLVTRWADAFSRF